MYFATLDQVSGELRSLELVPTRIQDLRCQVADQESAVWLKETLNFLGEDYQTRVRAGRGGHASPCQSQFTGWIFTVSLNFSFLVWILETGGLPFRGGPQYRGALTCM